MTLPPQQKKNYKKFSQSFLSLNCNRAFNIVKGFPLKTNISFFFGVSFRVFLD
jgi:hypothetical protein